MDKSVLGADSTVCYTRTDLGDIAALHEMKAQALMEVEEYFAAVEAAEAAVAAAPLWVPAWETLGRARLNFGEVDLAVVALERVRVYARARACVCVCATGLCVACLTSLSRRCRPSSWTHQATLPKTWSLLALSKRGSRRF